MNVAIKTEDVLGTRYRIGMWVSLASIAMLFTSLSSAYVVRSGVMNDWFPIAVPRVMFGSTALIMLSSVSIEIARRKLKRSISAQLLALFAADNRSRPGLSSFASRRMATTGATGNLSREQSVQLVLLSADGCARSAPGGRVTCHRSLVVTFT